MPWPGLFGAIFFPALGLDARVRQGRPNLFAGFRAGRPKIACKESPSLFMPPQNHCWTWPNLARFIWVSTFCILLELQGFPARAGPPGFLPAAAK